ncbi:hypothetical protein F5887DRAFT_1079686 [Amanita rubescens]|nr:hypothetical protein F5887DRAFT_1079686 [Amanita rubescens]
MSTDSIFPLEVEERIIDLLAEDAEDLVSVKTCSLVCRAFLPLCRKHIFASVVLNAGKHATPPSTTPTLERLLSTTPEIARCIRTLDYNIAVRDFTSPLIQVCLKKISRLQCLRVRHYNRQKLDWSRNPLRPALLHMLHLPTLTHLRLFALDNFVLSDLLPCINLKKLEIESLTAVDWVDNTFSAAFRDHSIQLNHLEVGGRCSEAVIKMCRAQCPSGRALFDFSFLTNISVALDRTNDIEALQELFERCGHLINVTITFYNPTSAWTSFADLLRPSMQTIKNLHVELFVRDNDDDPLFRLPSELEVMRSKNVIESITIEVVLDTEVDCKPGNGWGRLDELFTKTGWSALKKLSVAIQIYSYDERQPPICSESALRKLPETQFVRLSSSKTISFAFEVENRLV